MGEYERPAQELAYQLGQRRDGDLQVTLAEGLAAVTFALLELADAVRSASD